MVGVDHSLVEGKAQVCRCLVAFESKIRGISAHFDVYLMTG